MKRIVVTWVVGFGIVLAGAVQTTLHHRAATKQMVR